MNRGRRTLAALCAIAVLAAACGNSPSGDGAAPASDAVAPTTTSPATPEPEPEPEPAGTDEAPEPEPDPEPAGTDEAPELEPDPEPAGTDESATDEPTTTEPAVEEPVDPYPERHTFVALDGVPGVTDGEIRVSVVGIKQNNPLGTCILDCFVTGIQAYFDYINDSGGVYGRSLVIDEILDDELFRNQEHALKIIADNSSLAAFQATLLPSGWGDLNDAGVPTFVWNIHGADAVNRFNIFGNHVIGCPTCTIRSFVWIASQAGATRVGLLGYGITEASKVCAKAFSDSIDLYGPALGMEVAYFNDNMAYGLPNGIGPEVTQMIDAGVDFIATCMDLNAMLTLAQELERQGVRDQITLLHPNSYNDEFVAAAGDLFDGDYALLVFAAFEYEVDSPLRHAYDQWVPADGGPVAEQTLVGWINADLFVTGLLEAGSGFDRQSIIDSLNQITYDAGGLINPVDWSRQHTAVEPFVYD
ncbi:MAG: ABC transporter substrate-binding protein, partial [Acidimicrobiaceae bacterium]|nr:ABC transporter substrate-binding protein [Acidimicrobiaceae bacterium]